MVGAPKNGSGTPARPRARTASQGAPAGNPDVGWNIGLTPQQAITNPDFTPTTFFFRWLMGLRRSIGVGGDDDQGGGGTGAGTWAEEVPAGLLNGLNPTFTLSHSPIAGSLTLFLNIAQDEGTDFTISDSTITFRVPPKARDAGWFQARYQRS
jgi:hypothetical protein